MSRPVHFAPCMGNSTSWRYDRREPSGKVRIRPSLIQRMRSFAGISILKRTVPSMSQQLSSDHILGSMPGTAYILANLIPRRSGCMTVPMAQSLSPVTFSLLVSH